MFRSLPWPARRGGRPAARAARPRLTVLEGRVAPAVFAVTTTANAGPGSYRQAILDANAAPGLDTINFNIAPGGPQTVVITSVLQFPQFTEPVVIDGTTQPGYAGTPLIELGGFLRRITFTNLTGCTIRGLVLGHGVELRGGGGHTIQSNYLGTDAAGTTGIQVPGGSAPTPYGATVIINGSAGNWIGGPAVGEGNLISGYSEARVLITNSGASGNVIQGNKIGTDATGAAPIRPEPGKPAGGSRGVFVNGQGTPAPADNLIGGTESGAGNIIAFDTLAVYVVASAGNRVMGNSIFSVGEGIMLAPTAPGAVNDPGDADVGPNGQQNVPIIAGVIRSGSTTTVNGIVNSTPNRSFRVELFRTPARDPNDSYDRGPRRFDLGRSGRFLLGTVDVIADATGRATFSVTTDQVTDADTLTATATDLAAGNTSPFSAARPAVPQPWYAVGSGAGRPPSVKVYNTDGSLRLDFLAYEASFTGGVRVSMGDVTKDGVLDVITGTGVGGGPLVKVFDGRDGALVRSFFAYESSFRGGVNVSAYGSTVVTGAGVGGGPLVKWFDENGLLRHSFFAYDAAFRGGVSVAAAADSSGWNLVTAPGPGGGPHVKVWRSVETGGAPGFLEAEFMAFEPSFRGGVTVAIADVDNDRFQDVVAAPMSGRAPQVTAFRVYAPLPIAGPLNGVPLRTFNAYDPSFRGGVRVTAADLNFDGFADIITGPGPGGGPHVRAFDSVTGAELAGFLAFDPAFRGGVFVG